MECYLIDQGTLREFVKFLETFIEQHGDMPVLFEDDCQHFLSGNICIYDATEDRGLEDDETPYLRAVISS